MKILELYLLSQLLLASGLEGGSLCEGKRRWDLVKGRQLRTPIASNGVARVQPELFSRWLASHENGQRENIGRVASQIQYTSMDEYLTALFRQVDEMVERLGGEERVFLIRHGVGESNFWVFQLVTDYLYKRHPNFLFRCHFDPKEMTADDLRSTPFVYLDDASYTGSQAYSDISLFHEHLAPHQRLFVLVPFMSSVAAKTLSSVAGEFGLTIELTNYERILTGEEIRELAGVERSDMVELFGSGYEVKSLWYSDFNTADTHSLLSFRSFLSILDGYVWGRLDERIQEGSSNVFRTYTEPYVPKVPTTYRNFWPALSRVKTWEEKWDVPYP